MAEENYEEWTVEELQEELRAQEKPVSGNKDELIARLKNEEEPEEQEEEEPEQETFGSDATREQRSQQFPSPGDPKFPDEDSRAGLGEAELKRKEQEKENA